MQIISDLEEDILISLRRITQAIDLHSRWLTARIELTGPQLVSLRVLRRHGAMTPSDLARHVALSPATVTGIADRLLGRGLITRERLTSDRRLVELAITAAGRELLERSPSPLQERLARGLAALAPPEQANVRAVLAAVALMMGPPLLADETAETAETAAVEPAAVQIASGDADPPEPC